MCTARDRGHVIVVGGGPSGMTVAWLLARRGTRVTLVEHGSSLGGLWSCTLDAEGGYLGENSCKVYQSSYVTTPALLERIGTDWRRHFTPRHDLAHDWLRPFVRDASSADLAKIVASFARHAAGSERYRDESVAEYLERHAISERCRAWMRATALGGITGTLRMTMWELFHRLESNVSSILSGRGGTLHWNAQPPNARDGFVTAWAASLAQLGVRVELGWSCERIEAPSAHEVIVHGTGGREVRADAAFLAIPPPALSDLFDASPPTISASFARNTTPVRTLLRESHYTHLGVTWHFDRPLPRDLPLGGHNVRRGWHPILVQHPQYAPHLPRGTATVVVGSLSVDTTLRHARIGTLASAHSPEELAAIVWDDERRVDPSLPSPIRTHVHGLSSATQIVRHGPLRLCAHGLPLWIATNLHGQAPYFTASLESAIQAGAAAALAFDPSVESLPTRPRSAVAPDVGRGRDRREEQPLRRADRDARTGGRQHHVHDE